MISEHLQALLFAGLSGLLLSYLLTPLAMRFGYRAGMVDMPGGRRIHDTPTPRSGGLALFIGFTVTLACLAHLGLFSQADAEFITWTRQIIQVSLLVVVLGLIDDRFEIGPLVKFFGQIAVAILAWRLGLRLERLVGLDLHPMLDLAVTSFLFIAGMNAYNLIDGMDGIAGGLGAVTGLGLAGLNLLMSNYEMAAASLALTGACLGFLRYNFYPAQVFLGDTGSMLIGFFLIAITLGSTARSAAAVMLVIPMLTLGVPMIDTGLAIWRRSVRKALKQNTRVTQGDRDHLHHRLARRGLTQRRIAILLYSIQAAAFGIGLLWLFGQNHRIAIFTIGFFAGAYVLLRYLATVEMTDSGRMIVDGIRRPGRNRLFSSLLPFFDIAILIAGLLLLHFLAFPTGLLILPLGRLLREAGPPIVAGPLVLIWALRYYRPRWSRARALDYFYLMLLATGGILLGFALSALTHTHTLRQNILLSLIYLAMVLPPILTLRIFPRLVQDLLHFHERQERADAPHSTPRALVYGAGYGYTLLTRAESFDDSPRRRKYQLIGLIDDDFSLRNSHIHGYPVLGTLRDLPDLIRNKKITEVIMTTEIQPDHFEKLLQIAREYELILRKSTITHTEIYTPPSAADA